MLSVSLRVLGSIPDTSCDDRKHGRLYGADVASVACVDIDVEGSFVGDRHRELFSAAANLAEFASVDELAVALLTPCGLNSGLTRSDVQRQIECGLKHGGRS